MWAAGVLLAAVGALRLSYQSAAAPTCISFRAIAGCNITGPRDTSRDHECEIAIQMQAGFCECEVTKINETDQSSYTEIALMGMTDCTPVPFRCVDVCANKTFMGEAQPADIEAAMKKEIEVLDAKEEELAAAGDEAVTGIEQTVDAARRARDHVAAVWDAKGGNKPAWKTLGDAGRALSGAGATLTAAADQVLPVLKGTEPTTAKATSYAL
jgi:hypothetical protein